MSGWVRVVLDLRRGAVLSTSSRRVPVGNEPDREGAGVRLTTEYEEFTATYWGSWLRIACAGVVSACGLGAVLAQPIPTVSTFTTTQRGGGSRYVQRRISQMTDEGALVLIASGSVCEADT